MNLENYTPEIINDEYVLLLAELKICQVCKSKMLFVPKQWFEQNTFPNYINLNLETQLKRANIAIASTEKQDDEYVCKECVDAGKITIECYACNKRKPSSKIKERYGDPPGYLCTDCYETLSAKQWDEIVEKLEDLHRYDYD